MSDDLDRCEHIFSDLMYAKKIKLKAGERVMKHVHSYEHISIVACGRVRVKHGRKKEKTYWAGDYVVIEAGKPHEIYAECDSIWYCIHPTDEKNPDKIDKVLIGR